MGLLRALYRATPADDSVRRNRMKEMGKSLRIAIDLAQKSPVGSVGARAAWLRAEEVCRHLGDVVDIFLPATKMLDAARDAVVGERYRVRPKRPER